MRILFVHHVVEDRGSAQDMHHYAQVARELGHEVALYGPTNRHSAFEYSVDVRPDDAVVFIFEWTTDLQWGDHLDLLRLVARVPRARRMVIDCDGKYNDAIAVVGDVNHPDAESARRWVEICDNLSDKICQPTLHPLRPNVQPFFFHAYDPAWETPLDFNGKDFGMCYVGNNWFRWRPLFRVLRALEPIRTAVGRIGIVGHGWDSPAPWAGGDIAKDAWFTDPAYLRKLGVEVLPPVPFDQVVPMMGRGVFSPVVYRPLFDHLRLVTCRTFETPAAGTIPLFAQTPEYAAEIYGVEAVALTLPSEAPEEKIEDLLRRPRHYAAVVEGVRRRLAEQHSYAARLRTLVDILEQ
jgi:hypothetical protein